MICTKVVLFSWAIVGLDVQLLTHHVGEALRRVGGAEMACLRDLLALSAAVVRVRAVEPRPWRVDDAAAAVEDSRQVSVDERHGDVVVPPIAPRRNW